MIKRIGKLQLDRESVRRLGGGTRAAEAWTAPHCNTDAYSFCTPCAESVNVCAAG